ncbi:MAG TPA: GntR family transcriptional regulator [Longimicrobiaceae bacterium]|nr:GntR family transcriptional regulator [Longimicrobiaceae bacterium]
MPLKKGDEVPAQWPQVEAATLADQVYHLVRNRILHRELPPGTFIREHAVSQATGVSRTPVREALNRLASQDFLERVPHRGFRIPDTSWETLVEIYPIVTALELLAGSEAFGRLRSRDIEQLKTLNRKLSEAGKKGDARAQTTLNNAFHKVLSDCSANRKLSELLDQLRSQVVLLETWYYTVPEHVEDSVRDHNDIIVAIEKGDFEKALTVLERNYSRGREALEREMARQNGSTSPDGASQGPS